MGMVTGSGNTAIHQLFSYDSSGNVVSVDYSSNGGSTFTTYYYLRNAQNDIVKIIDGNGATVVEYKYDSWGKPISTTGSLSATLGANQPFRYRGYVYDAETGWYYLQSRYYDPSVGRFVSADVLLSTGQGVIGHNSYAYCGNNPITRVDPSGSFWLTTLIVTLAIVIGTSLTGCSSTTSVGDAPNYVEVGGGSRDTASNCYAFAIGMYDKSYDPGYFSSPPENYTVDAVAEAVINDMHEIGRKARIIENFDSEIADDEYRIAVRVRENPKYYMDQNGFIRLDWDYHFMLQTSSGKWAEKHGPGGNSILHESGNPSTLSWDLDFRIGY